MTIIDVPGPNVDLTDDAAIYAFLKAILTPDDRSFWVCPVSEPEVKQPNVRGSERVN